MYILVTRKISHNEYHDCQKSRSGNDKLFIKVSETKEICAKIGQISDDYIFPILHA